MFSCNTRINQTFVLHIKSTQEKVPGHYILSSSYNAGTFKASYEESGAQDPKNFNGIGTSTPTGSHSKISNKILWVSKVH